MSDPRPTQAATEDVPKVPTCHSCGCQMVSMQDLRSIQQYVDRAAARRCPTNPEVERAGRLPADLLSLANRVTSGDVPRTVRREVMRLIDEVWSLRQRPDHGASRPPESTAVLENDPKKAVKSMEAKRCWPCEQESAGSVGVPDILHDCARGGARLDKAGTQSHKEITSMPSGSADMTQEEPRQEIDQSHSGDFATAFGPFEVLVFREPAGDHLYWIAQGVDYDLCVQAPTLDDLLKRWWKHVAGQIMSELVDDGSVRMAHGRTPERFIERFVGAKARGGMRCHVCLEPIDPTELGGYHVDAPGIRRHGRCALPAAPPLPALRTDYALPTVVTSHNVSVKLFDASEAEQLEKLKVSVAVNARAEVIAECLEECEAVRKTYSKTQGGAPGAMAASACKDALRRLADVEECP